MYSEGLKGRERQPVRLGHAVDVITRYHRTSTRHILHHKSRVSRDILGHVLSQRTRPKVKSPSGGKTYDDSDSPAFIKRFGLRLEAGAEVQAARHKEADGARESVLGHNHLPGSPIAPTFSTRSLTDLPTKSPAGEKPSPG